MSTIARRSALGATIAALVLGASAPAFAHVRPTVFDDGSKMTLDQKTGNFCLTSDITGTRIPQVTCQSKTDWAKDGVNISMQ